MASNVVRATLLADAQRFKAGFKDAEKATTGFDKRISATSSLVKGLLAGAAATAVIAFSKDSIRAFSELEQAVGGTEAVFGDASTSIDRMARRSADSMGLSEAAFRTATTSFGGQLKRMTGDVDFAAEHSIELTRIAADLAATYGGTTTEAVQALGAAFRGEADPAERFNLDLKVGKINAKALEMGLADSTGAIDDQAKAQATLALITEQSADAQGQFGRESDTLAGKQQRLNARLENTKALLGRALAPAMSGALDLTGAFTSAVSDLALQMLLARGEITAGEKALIQYEAAIGKAVETTEEFIDSLIQEGLHLERVAGGKGGFRDAAAGAEEFGQAVREQLDVIDPGIDTAREWRKTIEAVGDQMGLSKEQIEAAKDAYNDYIVAEGNAARDASRHQNTWDGVAEGFDDIEGEADDATSALQRFEDEVLSQTDPLYALVEAEKEVAEAKQAVTEAEAKFTKDSPEYRAALIELAKKHDALTAAQIKVGEQSDMTAEQYKTHLRDMGQFTAEQIDIIMAEFARVNAFQFANKWINVGAQIRGDLVPGTGGRRQHGGHVGANQAVTVGEAGVEVFVPSTSGRVVPNHKLGTATSTIINITVNALDPQSAAKAVVQAIETYKRNNGGRLPF